MLVIPIRCSVRAIRTAATPRFAIRIFVNKLLQPHLNLNRSGVIAIAWVVQLGAIGDQNR